MSISKRNSWSFISLYLTYLADCNGPILGPKYIKWRHKPTCMSLKDFKWPISNTQTKKTKKRMIYVNYLHSFFFLTGDSVLPRGSHQQRGVLRRVQESTGWENLTVDQWVAEPPGFTWKLCVFAERNDNWKSMGISKCKWCVPQLVYCKFYVFLVSGVWQSISIWLMKYDSFKTKCVSALPKN